MAPVVRGIVREGKRFGIPTRVNATLTSLVGAVEESYRDRIKSR